ncbi:protein PELPK2-like [Quercus robur]|uniref:protein PELPK2-like n=1 Tax=Quercus robur TaxID=38942 RepID=UPI0021630A86|nr:protein PELPK2-like [Quercus robur]
MAFSNYCFLLSLVLALSLATTSLAARNILDTPALLTLQTQPTLPKPTLPMTLPDQTTLPQLPSTQIPSLPIPKFPAIPTIPELTPSDDNSNLLLPLPFNENH